MHVVTEHDRVLRKRVPYMALVFERGNVNRRMRPGVLALLPAGPEVVNGHPDCCQQADQIDAAFRQLIRPDVISPDQDVEDESENHQDEDSQHQGRIFLLRAVMLAASVVIAVVVVHGG